MTSDENVEISQVNHPLTREDVEQLCKSAGSTANLDLSYRNLRQIDLSYFDLQGANLRGANLQEANLSGATLCSADLREASLRGANLDGADLSGANLGDSQQNHTDLRGANLSYSRLRRLDLRNFDLRELLLQNADLNETDLRDALLQGADLCGADLSTAILHGPELAGAKLYHDERLTEWLRNSRRNTHRREKLGPLQAISAPDNLPQTQARQALEGREALSDREAYALGKQIATTIYDPTNINRLFPLDFDFTITRQLFDAWQSRAGRAYTTQELAALWIGFAHRLCDLYYHNRSET